MFFEQEETKTTNTTKTETIKKLINYYSETLNNLQKKTESLHKDYKNLLIRSPYNPNTKGLGFLEEFRADTLFQEAFELLQKYDIFTFNLSVAQKMKPLLQNILDAKINSSEDTQYLLNQLKSDRDTLERFREIKINDALLDFLEKQSRTPSLKAS